MKNTHACPKCRSSDIIRIPGFVGGYGSGNNIPVAKFSFNAHVLVARYVCAGCGYSEEWIDSPEDIERLRKKYQ